MREERKIVRRFDFERVAATSLIKKTRYTATVKKITNSYKKYMSNVIDKKELKEEVEHLAKKNNFAIMRYYLSSGSEIGLRMPILKFNIYVEKEPRLKEEEVFIGHIYDIRDNHLHLI